MMSRKELAILTPKALRRELAREEAKARARRLVMNVAGMLVVIAAITTLIATRILNLLQVNGESMAPTLKNGEYVIVRQTREVEAGDIVGFHYGGDIFLKRVIGCGGDIIEIGEDGTVFVNGRQLAEPYLTEKSIGASELEFPYKVPEGMYFVLGDNRAVSIDSRVRAIGCVEKGQIIGKVVFGGGPFGRMEMLH